MDPSQWSEHLETIARSVLADTPLSGSQHAALSPSDHLAFVEGFRDELGHRRAVDRPILLWLLGLTQAAAPPTKPSAMDASDLAVWWALHTGDPVSPHIRPGPGPIIGEAEFSRSAIEATTETELGALHALWHHAQRAQDPALFERCHDAARWHVDTLQPDNGTNHPWAIHVFLHLAEIDAGYAPAAGMHAEGLLHNATVRSGKPDLFSACLLLDSARAIRTFG